MRRRSRLSRGIRNSQFHNRSTNMNRSNFDSGLLACLLDRAWSKKLTDRNCPDWRPFQFQNLTLDEK